MALSISEHEMWARLESLEGPDSLLDFISRWNVGYEKPEHLREFIIGLWRAAQGERVRMLVSVPPRHGKSETVLNFIPWFLLQRPYDAVAYVSYAADIAESKSKHARDIARMVGVSLRTDSNSSKEWRTTQGGGVLATGIGGPLVGHGVQALIVDDPTKNREQAESQLLRERNHQWFTSTATSRVEPGGSIFVVHQRWHDDDLIGRLEQQITVSGELAWESIKLPALDSQRRALWPSRWPVEELEAKKEEVGPYDWASLYQGEPRPRGGRLFQEPARYKPEELDLEGCRIAIGVDPAATADTSSDFSVAVVLAARGAGKNQRVYILDVFREQLTTPNLVRQLVRMQKLWGCPCFVEAVGGFKSIPQTMRDIDPTLRVVDVHPVGDKFARSLPVQAAWSVEKILVPLVDEPWVNTFLDEVLKFTGVKDKHDDQVDALVHAFVAVDRRLQAVRAGSQEAAAGGFGP